MQQAHKFPLYRGRILGRTWDKSLKSFPPCDSQSTLLSLHFYFPFLSKNGLKLVCNLNIAYGNLKSENSQDYAQQPRRNCMFMNSASEVTRRPVLYTYTTEYYGSTIFSPASSKKNCRTKVQEATSARLQHNSKSKTSSGFPIKVRI